MNKQQIINPNNKEVRDYKSCMTGKIFICIIMIISFQSIYAQDIIDWSFTREYTEKEVNNLRKRILKGDTMAYDEYVFHAKRDSPECLPYALFMANNYNYSKAYSDVYFLTIVFYKNSYLIIDSISYSFAFQYLLKGAELGNPNCNNDLAHIYYFGNRYIEQDTVKAKEFYTRKYENYDEKQSRWDAFKLLNQRSFEVGYECW